LNDGQEWKQDGICRCKMSGYFQSMPTVSLGICGSFVAVQAIVPFTWFQSVLHTNITRNVDGEKVGLGEMLRWVGLWSLMATYKGFSRRQFWSAKEVDEFEGAPNRFGCRGIDSR
jgi:hypothetical protein